MLDLIYIEKSISWTHSHRLRSVVFRTIKKAIHVSLALQQTDFAVGEVVQKVVAIQMHMSGLFIRAVGIAHRHV